MNKLKEIRVINIPQKMHNDFKVACTKKGISMSMALKHMILEFVVKDREGEK